ncbi:MAG: hypothetical protein RMK92_08255 [Armatimonadota bacterium]|nr:hypothetical protein [Armatimonadota bacterium]
MKREVSPVTAAVVIIVVMLIVGAAYWFFAERRAGGGADVPAVPPDVQAEFQRRMGGMTPGGQPALSPGR